MGYNKSRRRKENNNGKFILPLLFFCSVLWLIASSLTDKSPTEAMSDAVSWVMGRESQFPNKAELQAQ